MCREAVCVLPSRFLLYEIFKQYETFPVVPREKRGKLLPTLALAFSRTLPGKPRARVTWLRRIGAGSSLPALGCLDRVPTPDVSHREARGVSPVAGVCLRPPPRAAGVRSSTDRLWWKARQFGTGMSVTP